MQRTQICRPPASAFTALSIPLYPVQRQRLDSNHDRIVSSSGCSYYWGLSMRVAVIVLPSRFRNPRTRSPSPELMLFESTGRSEYSVRLVTATDKPNRSAEPFEPALPSSFMVSLKEIFSAYRMPPESTDDDGRSVVGARFRLRQCFLAPRPRRRRPRNGSFCSCSYLPIMIGILFRGVSSRAARRGPDHFPRE